MLRPGVLVVLSGMSSEDQLADNLAAMSPFQPLTKSEQNALTRAVRIDKRAQRIPCTGCRYCMPCPFGVDIPGLFKAYNRCAAAKSTGRFLKESGDIPAAARPAAPAKQRRGRCFGGGQGRLSRRSVVGVRFSSFLNTRMKLMSLEKPTVWAMSLMFISVFRIRLLAWSTRRRLMYWMMLTP